MLRVESLDKRLGAFALEDVSFEVAEGEYLVLLGPSGAGKTVLLETLAGVMRPDRGRILLDGHDITRSRPQHRPLGLVYQDQALFPHMTVRRNIAYGLRRRGGNRRTRVAQIARAVGAESLLDRRPGTLSGGEAQRVALARTLATAPCCLLLDEPLSALDRQARNQARALLRRLHRDGQTVIHVTHDYEEALSLATRVGILEERRDRGAARCTLTQHGTVEAVFHHPTSEFVARFVGIRNCFHGHLERDADDGGLAHFVAKGMVVQVLSDAAPGPGCLMFRSEDVTLSQNCFRGVVTDIAPAILGVEVLVDVGLEVAALITAESRERLGLERGQKVWISLKATAARFVEE